MDYSEIDKYCEANRVLEVIKDGKDIVLRTLKGDLIFKDVTEDMFRATHCSCTDIRISHYSVVAEIIRRNYGYASSVVSIANDSYSELL